MIYNDYSLFLSWYPHGSKNRQQYVSISWQGRMERTWQSLLFPVLPRNHSVQNLQRRARKYFLFSEKFPCFTTLYIRYIPMYTARDVLMISCIELFEIMSLLFFDLDNFGSPSLKWQMWHFVAIRWLGSCCKRRSDSRTHTTPSSWVRSSHKHQKKSGSTRRRVVPSRAKSGSSGKNNCAICQQD